MKKVLYVWVGLVLLLGCTEPADLPPAQDQAVEEPAQPEEPEPSENVQKVTVSGEYVWKTQPVGRDGSELDINFPSIITENGEVVSLNVTNLDMAEFAFSPFNAKVTGYYENNILMVESSEFDQEDKERKQFCEQDSDCVAAQCCHPHELINKEYAADCSAIACTASCQGPLDCRPWRAVCVDNKCDYVIEEEYE